MNMGNHLILEYQIMIKEHLIINKLQQSAARIVSVFKDAHKERSAIMDLEINGVRNRGLKISFLCKYISYPNYAH